MNAKEYRAELVKIMPGYSWTVHKQRKIDLPTSLVEELATYLPEVLIATGIQSSGSTRLSTLQVERRDHGAEATYTARSSGYGTRAPWLYEYKDGTLARALRGLQIEYERAAIKYRSHALALQAGRRATQEGGAS